MAVKTCIILALAIAIYSCLLIPVKSTSCISLATFRLQVKDPVLKKA